MENGQIKDKLTWIRLGEGVSIQQVPENNTRTEKLITCLSCHCKEVQLESYYIIKTLLISFLADPDNLFTHNPLLTSLTKGFSSNHLGSKIKQTTTLSLQWSYYVYFIHMGANLHNGDCFSLTLHSHSAKSNCRGCHEIYMALQFFNPHTGRNKFGINESYHTGNGTHC